MTPAVLALLSALAAAGVTAAASSARPWIAAVAAGAIAFETAVLRPRLDAGLDTRAVRSWRRLELVGLVVGVKALQVLAGSDRIVDAEFVLATSAGIGTWVLVNATLTDLDGIRRAIESVDGSTPMQRIRTRFVAVGLVVVACAAFGVVGVDGLLDLRRGAETEWSWAPLGYVLVGLGALGATSRMAERGRWQRDGVDVDPRVADRWSRSVMAIVGGLALLGLIFSVVDSGVTAVPSEGLAASGPVGQWLVDQAERLRSTPSVDRDVRDGSGEDPVDPLGGIEFADRQTPDWLGDLGLVLLVGMIFAWVIARAARRRTHRESVSGGPSLLEALRLVVAAIRDLLVELWSAIRRLLRAVVGDADGSETAVLGHHRLGDDAWNPNDPFRRRIAAAYRQTLEIFATRSVGRHPAETAREHARRVADDRLDVVAGGFEEARWSDHVLGETDAGRVERAAGELGESSTTGSPDG